MTKEVLVEVDAISRAYGSIRAVNGISFQIRQGEVLGFLGPNGAGKSSTMQIVAGTLAPSAGRVRVAGHDLQEQPRAAKRNIGYLPEYPPLYRELTVDEYLSYCAALHGIARRERKAARERTKARCGLKDVGHRVIGNLSKGYQQRAGLAQAIIHSPPLIILDEPTVGLDPIQIREVRELIRELGREHGVILSTHILPEVQASCDRVQIINQGNLVLSDTIDNLAQHLQSRTLVVAFRKPVDPAMLAALPGVTRVQAETEQRLRVFHAVDSDPTDAILALVRERDLGLQEIQPAQASLEEIFLQLTRQDAAAEGA